MQNGMAMDFSWLSSAEQYLKLYEKTVAQKAAGSPASERGTGKQQTAGSRKKTDDSRQKMDDRRQTTDDRRKRDKA